MKKLLLILLFPLALGAQNFKHESGGINGVSDYSEGTIETDTLRTRYIRLLDGLNSDSIASYIYFDGDTSRWTGDPIKIGNNSIIVKDDTVKISNAMLTVSGQVQADTLVPYHNSTIYIRHFTVDTIEIVKYFHQQEVALFDSLLYVAGDNDTLKFDASVAANVIDYEHDNVTVAKLDSAGNWTAKKIVANDSVRVGRESTADNVVPIFTMKGDADSDASATTTMTYTQTFTGLTTPTSAYVSNTLNQGNGYYFDRGIGINVAPVSTWGLYSVYPIMLKYNIANTSTSMLMFSPANPCTKDIVVRYSPNILLTGFVWDSTATAASKLQNFTQEVIPVSGGTVLPAPSASTARLRWSFDHNGGGYNEIMSLRGDGNLGLGTTNPLFDLSIVNSNPATNNGVHVVDSNVNKNRTTYAQATDSASAMLSTIGGNGWLRLRASNSDSAGMYADGTYFNVFTNDPVLFKEDNSAFGLLIDPGTEVKVYDDLTFNSNDVTDIGSSLKKAQVLWLSDNGYIGGNGQTAKLTIGTMNTMTEETDSCVVVTPTAGSGSVMLASSVGSIVNFVGVQPNNYVSAINQMWVNVTRDTLFIRGATGNAFYLKLTDLGSEHGAAP